MPRHFYFMFAYKSIWFNKHALKECDHLLSKQKRVNMFTLKEWILEEWYWIWSEHLCSIHSFWSDHRDHSGIPNDPWGHSKMSE